MIAKPPKNFLLAAGSLILLLCAGGCGANARLERHVKRADAYFAKAEYEKARLEYLNAFRLNQNDPHVSARLGESFLETGDLLRGGQLLAHARQIQPTNAQVRVKLGSLLLLAGNAKEARAEAEAVLQADPANGEGLILLANSCATTNEVSETRARIESLLAASADKPALHMALGILSQKMGNLPAAEASFQKAAGLDPKSSKNHFALAAVQWARGDTNNAELHFKAASDAAPVKSIERLGYAEFLLKTGRLAESKKLLLESVEKFPDFIAAWNNLTQLAFVENQQDQAAEYIAKALARDPKNRDALLNQSRLKLARREFAGAAADLENLAGAHPRDSQIQYQLAVAQIANDDINKAIASLDKAISFGTNNVDAILLRSEIQLRRNDYNVAIPELLRVTRQFPRVGRAHFLLASAYRQRGNPDDAIAVYQNLAKIFPSDPQPLQLIGAVYRQQSKLQPAREAYESALRINPDFLPAIDDLIELDILANQHDAALSRIQTYIEKYPDKPMPRLLQAKVFFNQKKNAQAEAAVKKAIELDPEFYPAHRTLADFYIRTQQTDPALAKLEAMVQKNNKDSASYMQMGMLYESKNDYKRARDAYENVLRINPSAVYALNNLAYLTSERFGDIDLGLQHARKARDLAPYDPFTADTFGWIVWRKGDYSQALGVLQQAAEKLPEQPEVQYHLGMAYYMNGSGPPALAALTKAVQSTNDFNGKDKARGALAILNIDPARATPQSIAALHQAIADNPSDVLAYRRLGQIHEAQANWDKARESYEAALQKNPKSTVLLGKLAELNAGPLKRPDRALELAKQAWAMSQSAELAAILGPVGVAAGDYKWAYGVLLEAQRAQPGNAELSYYSGLAAYALGRISQAGEALNQAAQLPALPPAIAKIARPAAQLVGFYAKTVPASQAQAAIAAAEAVDPRFPPALMAKALLAEQKGDFQGARAQYEALLKAHPGCLLAQRHLAILLAEKLGDDASASRLGAALRPDFPEDAELLKALGKVAYRRHEYSEATRLLSLANSHLPNDADLLYHLGMAQFHQKDKGAKATLTRAVSLEPETKLTADARKALEQLK